MTRAYEVVPRCPAYGDNFDLLVGLDGLHVLQVDPGPDRLRVVVESAPSLMGCPRCGVVAVSRGRREVRLVDPPSFGRPVSVRWRKRTWSCPEPACPAGTFTEQDNEVAVPRALLTVRACWWAIGQLRREHASVAGLARQLGTTWRTVWRAVNRCLRRWTPIPPGSRTSRSWLFGAAESQTRTMRSRWCPPVPIRRAAGLLS